jgi:BTB/POZ domain-containing protein 13
MGNYLTWSRSRADSREPNDEDEDETAGGDGCAAANSPRRSLLFRRAAGLKRKHRPGVGNSQADRFDDDFNTALNLMLNASTSGGSSNSLDSSTATAGKPPKSSFYTRVSGFSRKASRPNGDQHIPSQLDEELLTPSRKKMRSTSSYIYNTLFINGENSDICVRALGKEWMLHKLYLCQSPYFDSMFKGSKWKESGQSHIEIAIPDQNITERALFITFGSFYSEEVAIMPLEAISVLACASLFSLDGLISQCELIMIESMGAHTASAFYEAASIYGANEVAHRALKWFRNNIIISHEVKLAEIGLGLFETILSSNDLMIIRVETDLYSLCKRWLYFQLNRHACKLESKSWQKVTNEYFKDLIGRRMSESAEPNARFCLLDDEAYSSYANVFRKIRIKNILGDLDSLKLLYNDRLIPFAWIEPYYFRNWLNVLFVDQDHLSNEFQVDKAEFDAECMRFGRILDNDSFYNWRWVRKIGVFLHLHFYYCSTER